MSALGRPPARRGREPFAPVRFFAASLTLLLQLLPLPARAQIKKIEVAYSAISATQAAVWFTKEAGVFEKHDLSVNLNYVASGTRVVQALLAGEFPIGIAGSAAILANLAGGDAVFVGGIVNVPAFYLLVTPEIKRIEDLRGKVLGVTRFGASTDFALRYALRQWGLEPGKDVTILQVGGQPELIAAMKAGAIQAAPVTAPAEIRGRKAGFTVLTDLAKSGLQYPLISIVSTRSFIKKDPDTVRNFLRAYAAGTHRFFREKALAMKVIGKYTRTEDPEILESAYAYATQFVEKIPRPPFKGVEIELQEIALTQPGTKGRKVEEFVDGRFFEELEASGFFKSLQ